MTRTRWMMLGVAVLAALAMTAMMGWAKGEGGKAKVELPPAAAEAVAKAFPTMKIEKVKAEEENGVMLFEVELEEGETEVEVEVGADGLIVSVETEIALKDVPEAAAAAILAAAEGGKVDEVKKEEIMAEAKDGQIAPLNPAKVVYEAEIEKGTQEGEIAVDASGAIVEPLKWKDKSEEGKDEDEK
ncbi:MAG: hypothetical protein IMZ44_13730 [Planctomycetes bacterium]|nr:hypothetical protein [Planctomycetota bacterium]